MITYLNTACIANVTGDYAYEDHSQREYSNMKFINPNGVLPPLPITQNDIAYSNSYNYTQYCLQDTYGKILPFYRVIYN